MRWISIVAAAALCAGCTEASSPPPSPAAWSWTAGEGQGFSEVRAAGSSGLRLNFTCATPHALPAPNPTIFLHVPGELGQMASLQASFGSSDHHVTVLFEKMASQPPSGADFQASGEAAARARAYSEVTDLASNADSAITLSLGSGGETARLPAAGVAHLLEEQRSRCGLNTPGQLPAATADGS